MFGGGAKKEKKDESEDRGDNSGSAKAQRDAATAAKGGEVRVFFWGETWLAHIATTEQQIPELWPKVYELGVCVYVCVEL